MIDSFSGEYAFLSNFYPCDIEYGGLKYPSVEHAYVACKSSSLEFKNICASSLFDAAAIKKLGRSTKLINGWDDKRLFFMEELVRIKFTNNIQLKADLLATGDEELVEGNWWGDVFFGVCKGVGENNLGKILMKVRSELCDDIVSDLKVEFDSKINRIQQEINTLVSNIESLIEEADSISKVYNIPFAVSVGGTGSKIMREFFKTVNKSNEVFNKSNQKQFNGPIYVQPMQYTSGSYIYYTPKTDSDFFIPKADK